MRLSGRHAGHRLRALRSGVRPLDAGAGKNTAALDDLAEALWRKTEAAWQDPAAHDVFLKHCSLKGLLAAAGRRYRERIDRDPSDPIAPRMQARVLSMATIALGSPTRPPAVVTRTRWFWGVVALGVCAGVVSAFLIGR